MIAAVKIKRPRQPVEDRPLAEALLVAYRLTGEVAYRNRVVELYLPLAWTLASGHRAKTFVPVEELQSYACDGLIRATEKWDATRNVSFGFMAQRYIRFGISEGLRTMCQSTRTQRERGEAPTWTALPTTQDAGACPHDDYSRHDLLDEFTTVVERAELTWPERLLVVLAFREGYSVDEIAETLDASPGDVRLLLRILTAKLGDGKDAPAPPAPPKPPKPAPAPVPPKPLARRRRGRCRPWAKSGVVKLP